MFKNLSDKDLDTLARVASDYGISREQFDGSMAETLDRIVGERMAKANDGMAQATAVLKVADLALSVLREEKDEANALVEDLYNVIQLLQGQTPVSTTSTTEQVPDFNPYQISSEGEKHDPNTCPICAPFSLTFDEIGDFDPEEAAEEEDDRDAQIEAQAESIRVLKSEKQALIDSIVNLRGKVSRLEDEHQIAMEEAVSYETAMVDDRRELNVRANEIRQLETDNRRLNLDLEEARNTAVNLAQNYLSYGAKVSDSLLLFENSIKEHELAGSGDWLDFLSLHVAALHNAVDHPEKDGL